MIDALWSDDDFRSFFLTMRHGFFQEDPDEYSRERFVEQARIRVAPEVRRRVLADIGTTVDASAVARVALLTLQDSVYSRRETWLLVSPNPWGELVELVSREITKSYRATVRTRSDRRTLSGIAKASSRGELTTGEGEDG